MTQPVIIIGGGLAGLACAVALATRNIPCVILESRPRLGGRASSFIDSQTGEEIDNCQHVSLGCCVNFRRFCETVGVAHFLRRETTFYFFGPSARCCPFHANPGPAPLHLIAAFAGLDYLSWYDRITIGHGLRTLAAPRWKHDHGESFHSWLCRKGQSENAIQRFWHVVLVSALSESLDRISIPHARKVFVDAFLADRSGWHIELPTVPLGRFYGDELQGWLKNRSVEIRLQANVTELIESDGSIQSVRLQDGNVIASDDFVLAVPFQRVLSLLPAPLQAHAQLRGIRQLEAAPISSVHLWFDRPISELPHAVIVQGLSQWVFFRSNFDQGSPSTTTFSEAAPFQVQVVISASRAVLQQGSEQAIRTVLGELNHYFPDSRSARLVHARLVTEHRAVFAPVPGVDQLRPAQQSPIANLQLAGDWTRTGWPATMEGAVRSGFLAAENILARRGISERCIQPDLPVAPLTQLFFTGRS